MTAIVIAEETTKPGFFQWSCAGVELWIAAQTSFRTSDGQLVPAGNLQNGTGLLVKKACVINGDLSISIPVVNELPTTNDSIDNPSVRYLAALVGVNANGTQAGKRTPYPDQNLASGFALWLYEAPATTWPDVVRSNLGTSPTNPRPTWPTYQQMVEYVDRHSPAGPATTVTLGTVEIDVAAVDSAHPVVVGANSYASTTHAGITKLTSAPTSATDPIAVGATDPHILQEISLSQYASLSAAATAAGTTRQLVIDTATAPGSNLDLSASVLRFVKGGAINPTTGITVTLGTFTAPRVQIFGGAGNIRFSGIANPVFFPEWWGVKGDAYTANDGAISAATAAFSSASHPSTSVDVNKNIIVYGAGSLSGTTGLNNALRTTVSSVPGGNYTLAATATATVTNTYFAMGTSNTTAMQKCFDSLPSLSMVHFAPGKYMMGGTTVPSGCTLYAAPNSTMFFCTSNSMFSTSSRDNVTIDGLSIDAGGFATGGGNMTVLGGTTTNNLTIQKCLLTDTFLTDNLAPVSTFSRQGILARNYDGLNIRFCRFFNGMRIKAHGSGTSANADVHDNYFYNMNENGFSLLDGTATGIARNINFHDNIMEAVMSSGNFITIGDDGFTLTVSAATNANPCVLTTSSAHGLTTGWVIYISGATGSWVSINGAQTVTVLSPTTFSIPVDSTGFGALTGTVRVGATQEQSNISITNNTFRGPLKLGTAFIQNKGNYLQRDIKFSGNIFDNSNGSALSSTMGINNANQTASAQQVVNFEAIGNVFLGDYDFAAFRAGNIGSGLIDANQFTPLSLGMRLFRIGTVSNLIISNNRLNNAGVGMYFVDGSASNLVVKDNNIIIGGVNNSVGVYIEAQSQAFAATFLRNTIIGPGGTFTNIYGIQDVEAGGGDTSGVIYLDNIITNINTTTALGSFKYRTLPDNALVTELPPATIPQLLSQNSSNNSTTPDVRGVSIVQEAYSASRTITAINNASPGVPFTIIFTTGNVTIQNNASIKLAGGVDFVATASDSITLVWNGTALQEISRSVN
jgi:hypothetical protein